jgi:UDP:flavonoid glycosyltransferase YjiC (YdhE family)
MKIVFAAIGSYGDINPYLSIAKELRRRGHTPVLATSAYYREAIEKAGVGFAPLHPDARVDDVELVKKVMDPKKGSEMIVRELVMPVVREMYADLERCASDADLLVSHMLTYAVPLYAEKTGKPWLSTVLAPLVFLSRYDVPVFPLDQATHRFPDYPKE